jgi:hypothetical protein
LNTRDTQGNAVAHTFRMPSNPLFMVYFAGATTLRDAARSLSAHKLHVVESADSLEVRWKPDVGPVFWVGLNAEPWVVVEAAEQAEAKRVPGMATLDRRFEVPMDDLDAALDEYNTLFEIQAVLQDLTGGYIVTSWNGNVIPPEA